VDRMLRGFRYLITVMLLFFVGMVPAAAALDFQKLPYYAGSDVKILSYFVSPPAWYLGLILLALGACVSFGNVWCRYLCPLGGLYGVVGSASACTVVRDPEACTDCTKCARACHAGIRVDKGASVRSPECDGCMDCVIACPTEGALTARAFGVLRMPWWAWPVAVVGLWLVVYGVALATGHWHSAMPESWFVQSIRTLGI
jgi:polyferredoxin